MEIERINEHTVKFYVSYQDVEQRGFDREEIWYNRDRSEQLFWEMMDEVNDQENFHADGPLWIQVQAMEKGLEVIVTKAQLSQDGQKLELPTENGKTIDMPVDEKIESLLEEKLNEADENSDQLDDEDSDAHSEMEQLNFTVQFDNFEDVIQLSHSFQTSEVFAQSLYHFEDAYYLYIQFDDENMNDDVQENLLSQILEYGHESSLTVHRLEEYGKVIFHDDVFKQIRDYFPQ
ncbi:adaptor protein MecA [Thalassobacillus pellis]|uniref:adaptor protein MecA n=1 Tax=Thalassobacillus pellis TaxID=748008 RepID=UPI001960AEB1|nr:adaptor protein MecA [Thalassobacillus pellis]MBM7554023.1 adapter protein MecA 1/2 [Thalassobacillus pellis]